MADKRNDLDDKVTSDVLGISGSDVPKSPDDPTTEYDEESIARRRHRMVGADEETAAEKSDHHGATGIDMGSGGEGTDVSGR